MLQVGKTAEAHTSVFQEECLEKAIKNHGLERSLKAAIPDEVYDSLEKEFDSIEKQ